MSKQLEVEKFDFFALTDFANPSGKEDAVMPVDEIKIETAPKIEIAAPPPPKKTYSETELAQAKTASFKEGNIQGKQEGAEQAQAEDAAITSSLNSKIEQLNLQCLQMQEEYIALLKIRVDETTALAIHVAKLVAGEVLKEQPENCIKEMLNQSLPMLLTEPHIILTTHPISASKITKQLDSITDNIGYKGTLTINSDSEIEPTDCTLEWSSGNAQKSTDKMWEDICTRLLPEIWHSKALANGITQATTTKPSQSNKDETDVPTD